MTRHQCTWELGKRRSHFGPHSRAFGFSLGWYFVNTKSMSDASGHILRPTTLGSCSQVQYPVKHFQNNFFLHQDTASHLNSEYSAKITVVPARVPAVSRWPEYQDDCCGLYTQKVSHHQRRSGPLLLHRWLTAERPTGLDDG